MAKHWKQVLGLAALGYWVVPFLGMQLANFGVLRRGSGALPQVALTFDDGPDPSSTPQVMDALEAAGMRGTFFVLGEQVLKYPELTREILARGHEIGAHGFSHRSAWLRMPWTIQRDMQRSVAVIEEVTGQKVRYFRPAHGVYTAATYFGLRRLGLQAVHWTIESHDWHSKFSPQDVQQRILDNLEPGGVVVMHDANLGARNCVAILPSLLTALQERGYQGVTVGQMHGVRGNTPIGLLQQMWKPIDKLYDQQHQVRTVSPHAQQIYRVGLAAYPGATDTPQFPAGTIGGELHLHSQRFTPMFMHSRPHTLQASIASLQRLAYLAEHDPEYQQIPVFFAVTLLHRIMTIVGFKVSPLINAKYARQLGIYMAFLRWMYSGKLNRITDLPQVAWMDRETLINTYGQGRTPNLKIPK